MYIWLYRSSVLLMLCVLGWQVYIYGMGDLTGQFTKEQFPWQYEEIAPYFQPTADTLIASAERAKEAGKEKVSEQLALRALAENPTSGRAAAHLLSLYSDSRNDSIKTTEIANIAGKLWPAHSYTHTRLADYWAKQERIDKIIPEWNILLIRNPELRSQIFPGLYQITSRPEYRSLLAPYINTPPKWWNAFFAFLARDADLAFLQGIYEQRLTSSTPLDESEKSNYVNRLLKDKRWREARDAWIKGLLPKQKKLAGSIYDSGFEGNSFNSGFDWNLLKNKAISIKPDITYGMSGNQALHILLRKDKPLNFMHVSQRLLLTPGHYQLSLRYRLDTFKTTKGLSWRIRCFDKNSTIIAETNPLKGQKPWSTLNTEFNVPEQECGMQQLRLETTSKYRHDWDFEGSLWFDDISITAMNEKKENE